MTPEETEFTLEELEFMQQHPRMPERAVRSYLVELKRGLALKEGARQAAERGVVTRAIKLR